jgi:flavin reductase (DIM6/NTAB) family NADH-FMN oxidoreductase RutF
MPEAPVPTSAPAPRATVGAVDPDRDPAVLGGARWRPSTTGQPLLDDGPARVVCSLGRTIEAGDHTIRLGRVDELDHGARQDWPLLCSRRRYLRIERAASVALRGKPDAT